MLRALALCCLLGSGGCDVLFELQTVPAAHDAATDARDARDDAPNASIAGLVAYYPMDTVERSLAGCMKEASGGPSGTCYGALPAVATGVIGGAYMFDGTQSVRLADDPVFDTPSFTVAAWEQLTVAQLMAFSCPLNRVQGSSSDDTWQVCLFDSGVYVNFNGASTQYAIPNIVGTWHHVAFTYDATSQQFVFWLDGANMFSGSSLPTIDPLEPISIGADLAGGSPDATFTGLVDELRFYNRALTAGEITMLATP